MANQRLSGLIYVRIDGVQRNATGSYTYNLGQPKREAIVGPDGIQGYKEMPQVPYIEGEITDQGDLDVAALQNITDGTITLELANGKSIVLRNAWYAADGNVGTEQANVQIRFEGLSAEEVGSAQQEA